MTEKQKLIRFLTNVGDDESVQPECLGTDCPPGRSPDNCGVCRYEYMLKRGWLSDKVKNEKAALRKQGLKITEEK